MNIARSLFVPLVLTIATHAAVIPNPRVSVGETVKTSGTDTWAAGLLVDGKFGNAWSYSAGSWAAVKLGVGPSKVLVHWNDVSGNWSDLIPSAGVCKAGTTYPSSYRILTSSNSTDGADGVWDTLVRVTENVVAGRAHVVEFAEASWVKMLVTAGSGRMDELEVYDASNGASDSWFFMGTSITMMTFKSPVADSNFSDLVHARVPSQTPSFVRGGVPCINSSQVLTSITPYLDAMAGNRYLAIEMGTNDAWGGGDWNLGNFTRNMQAILDSARGRGMEPILARTLATDSARAKWQIHPGYPKAIDSLTKKNGLVAGPDLDAWFRAHPSELNSDGVHPSAVGAQSIQRLWAEAMTKNLYATSTSIAAPRKLVIQRTNHGSDALGRSRTGKAGGVKLDAAGGKIELLNP